MCIRDRYGTNRALQQAEPLWVEVVFAQPARACQRNRIKQHSRWVGGIGEEAVIAQGQLQQRKLQAFDQDLSLIHI